ncbi:MAG TPA: sigma 54-interacting transcriptional regulator [Vicinamibacterales bacterium]|nr:sigma 54-interacting transcriptional regulator [Vicinamibacterales bacterium]
MTWIERPAVTALADMFVSESGRRPRVAGLWGPPGSGKRTAVLELARIARQNGFIPVSSRLIDSELASLWQGRHLFVISPTRSAITAGRHALIHSALRSPQPHILLVVGCEELRGFDGVGLDLVSSEKLVRAVRPHPLSPTEAERAWSAADASRGLPGRFVRLLWPNVEPAVEYRTTGAASRAMPRVAERAVAYGELRPVGRADDAVGRAAHLLRRGRPRDAQTVLEHAGQLARQHADLAAAELALIDIAVLSGHTWIDLARLDEAESVIGTALVAARSSRDSERASAACAAMARCLFWRGRYDDAAVVMDGVAAQPAVINRLVTQSFGGKTIAGARLRQTLLRARIAVGQRRFQEAMALVAATQQAAPESTRGAIACTAAFVHLAVGDLDAVDRFATKAILGARAARDPLCAIKARLLKIEADRRRQSLRSWPSTESTESSESSESSARSQSAPGARTLRHFDRLAPRLPAIVRARWELTEALRRNTNNRLDAAHEILHRLISETGLGALVLYSSLPRLDSQSVPDASLVPGATAAPIALVELDEILALIGICQTATDETVVLKEVCGRLRHHLHAAAVSFVVKVNGRYHDLAHEGPPWDSYAAERAMSAGVAIGPDRVRERIEAAAVVRYAGQAIGALSARWTLGSTEDLSRAPRLLTAAAAAAAPLVGSVLTRRDRAATCGASQLLGTTAVMNELRVMVDRAAGAPFSVLIEGESGSGKELVAKAIHRSSLRRQQPFVTLNSAAIPDDLVEAELFGHSRGAFTGASTDRRGVFEEAHGGTLFLDEVGELSARAQAKLLRVIQEGELRRIGENISRRIDVRVVSATNRVLKEEIQAGRFRLDLSYRLDVIHIAVPPLRERLEDLPLLAHALWREVSDRVGSRATLSEPTIAALARYHWPGNVRELQNVLAALAVRSPKRGAVPPHALPAHIAAPRHDESCRLDEARHGFEERFVRAALIRTGGHRARAAAELGVTRQGLGKLMTRLGIE